MSQITLNFKMGLNSFFFY